MRFVWWTSVLAEASRDERYSAITGESLDEALRTFVEADRASLGANAARITTRQRERFHAEGRRFRSAARQVAAAHEGLVAGPPWTRAFAEWGGLLRAAAPAWAMSPFVIGQVLPVDERFDLVIVDDASRTSLARTISGIARGDQLLVVGDHGQLPPATWTADAGVPAPKPPSRSLADVAARVLPTATLRDSAYPRPRVADLLVEGASAGEVVHPPAPNVRETVRLERSEIQAVGHQPAIERRGGIDVLAEPADGTTGDVLLVAVGPFASMALSVAERLRAGGAGIPAFFTATGVGTLVAEGKEVRNFNGRNYVMETGLVADLSIVKAWKADERGNLVFRKTARNFNPMMATAGKVTVVEVEEIVPTGSLDPDHIHTPGIYVDRLIQTVSEKRIEQRTVRQRSAA